MTAALLVPETYRTVEEQLLLFGGAVLLGIPAGLLFDCMRLLRRMVRHHTAVVVLEDTVFLLLVSLLLLCYTSAFARGEFRAYYVIGCMIGFVLYECTIGRAAVRLAAALLHVVWHPVQAGARGFALICKKLFKGFVGNSKKTQNAQKNPQNRLQQPP